LTSGSEISLRVTAGSTYRIALDGAGGAGGESILNYSVSPDPDTIAPRTRLRHFRVRSNRSVKLYFSASERRAGFRCKLDRHRWESCSSPVRLTALRVGRHVFRIAARDMAGNVDPTPVVKRFRIRG
jgi:hypothetical protein